MRDVHIAHHIRDYLFSSFQPAGSSAAASAILTMSPGMNGTTPRLKAFPVCHHADPVVGLHPEIITTFVTDIFIFRCPVSVYHFLTFRAFDLCFYRYISHTCTSYSASLLSLCPTHKKLPQTIFILPQR